MPGLHPAKRGGRRRPRLKPPRRRGHGMACQKCLPVAPPSRPSLVAVAGHQRGPPGRAFGGGIHDHDRHAKHVGDELAEFGRLRDPSRKHDLLSWEALHIEAVAPHPQVEHRRQQHRLGDVARRGARVVEADDQRRTPVRHARPRLVIHEGQRLEAAAVVGGGKELGDHGREGVAGAGGRHPAEHLDDRVHRRRAVPQPHHVDRLSVRSAEVVDRPIHSPERPVAHRVGDDARPEAHRHRAGCCDQRSGQCRRLIPFSGSDGSALGQSEQGGAAAAERATILSGTTHLGEQVAEGPHGRVAARPGHEGIEVGQPLRVVVKRLLVDRKHPGRIADTERPAAGEHVGDPAGRRGDPQHPRRLLGLVADRPQPPRDSHPLGHLRVEQCRELVPLGLVAAVAPQPNAPHCLAGRVGQHLAVHLPGNADRPHLHREPQRRELSPKVGHRHGDRLLPVARQLLLTLRRQPRHHRVAPLAGREDPHRLIGKDHRQALRADVDSEIALLVHVRSS